MELWIKRCVALTCGATNQGLCCSSTGVLQGPSFSLTCTPGQCDPGSALVLTHSTCSTAMVQGAGSATQQQQQQQPCTHTHHSHGARSSASNTEAATIHRHTPRPWCKETVTRVTIIVIMADAHYAEPQLCLVDRQLHPQQYDAVTLRVLRACQSCVLAGYTASGVYSLATVVITEHDVLACQGQPSRKLVYIHKRAHTQHCGKWVLLVG